jgi:hypothetical protein
MIFQNEQIAFHLLVDFSSKIFEMGRCFVSIQLLVHEHPVLKSQTACFFLNDMDLTTLVIASIVLNSLGNLLFERT